MDNTLLLCRDIKVPVRITATGAEHDRIAVDIARKRYRRTLLSRFGNADFSVYKKSVDARDKDRITFIYTVAAAPLTPPRREILERVPDVFEPVGVFTPDFTQYRAPVQSEKRPVVVGFGPAGMFCAYALAKAGQMPVVIERGSDVETRAKKVETYWNGGALDCETNVQFGEGGAGTFSDGKLLTRISDPLCGYVLRTLRDFGAPEEICYLAKPHIGTDRLRELVKRVRQEIIRLGGTVLFDCKLGGFRCDSAGRLTAAETADGQILPCTAVFLCIGHSARDTFEMLRKNGISLVPKPFSVGVRAEHLQREIDSAMYGSFAGCEALGPAQYTLSAKKGGRAVYSFCMCPGGVVVASASENGGIVTNGMSNYARDGVNANSAIAVSVDPADYGNTVTGAIAYQKRMETSAFALAGADGSAPIQLLGDFLADGRGSGFGRVLPTYTGKTAVCDIRRLFPDSVREMLCFGFQMFEKHIAGFSAADTVLTAPETRTSSPVRIERGAQGISLSCQNLYPCGEGAGYAGGITSAAVDGLKSALAYLTEYAL